MLISNSLTTKSSNIFRCIIIGPNHFTRRFSTAGEAADRAKNRITQDNKPPSSTTPNSKPPSPSRSSPSSSAPPSPANPFSSSSRSPSPSPYGSISVSKSSASPTSPAQAKTTIKSVTGDGIPFKFTSFENVHPVYEFSKDREDRVLAIGDLLSYVKSNPYQNDKFSDSIQVKDSKGVLEKKKGAKFSLFGVFDGHFGQIAAEYVRDRLPFEIVNSEQFAAEDYEGAIKKAYQATQEALLASAKYRPESPKYDFTSGTTASIALVAGDKTYFAQLGNTPIAVMRTEDEHPKVLYPQILQEDKDRLLHSGMFLMAQYAPVHPTRRTLFWNRFPRLGHEFKHGVANIAHYGALGDSLYEPENINAFLEVMRESNKEFGQKKVTDFDNFRKKLLQSERWPEISKHVNVPDKREFTGYFINGLLEGAFSVPQNVSKCSLRREPSITVVPNKDVKAFVIVSDGLLCNKYANDDRPMLDLNNMIKKDFDLSRELTGVYFHKWNYGLFNRDISGVLVSFEKK